MKTKQKSVIAFSTPIKIPEIVFVWCVVLIFWHSIFTIFFASVDNIEYVQWAATAFSIILISKYLLARVDSKFETFLGSRLRQRDLPELSAVLLISLLLGVGCWAGLVLMEAKINLEWTFSWWGLISPTTFDEIRWSRQWIIINLICGCVAVPVTEEIIFRGFILNRLRQKYSLRLAIVISSLIFTIFHLNKSFIGSFAHGIVFAVLAVRFASLHAPMLVHGLYNAFVTLFQLQFGMFMSVEKARMTSAGYWLTELFCLAIGVVSLLIYLRHATVDRHRPGRLAGNE